MKKSIEETIMAIIIALLLLSCSKPDYLDQRTEIKILPDEGIRFISKDSVISFYFSPDVPNTWKESLQAASKEWEGIINKKFIQGSKEKHTTYIRVKDMQLDWMASARYPNQWGNTGDTLSININHLHIPGWQQKMVLQHELGHLIGLVHIYSVSSVMNSPVRTGFTSYDSLIIKKLFL